jgi:group I intron endonuclease
MTGIYQIVCKTTEKKYIGSTWKKGGFKVRWASHLKLLRAGTHSSTYLQNSWNKYGEDNFLFLVIDVLPPNREICIAQEQMYFDNCDRATLLNGKFTAAGGNGGARKGKTYSPHSQDTKDKISASAIGNTRGAGNKGRTQTPQARANMKAGAIAREERKRQENKQE